MKDNFGRDLNYLRISITDRCNLRCLYCMPEDGVELLHHDEILSFEELYQIVKVFVELGVTKLRITGGEPLVRLGLVDFIRRISNFKELNDIALTTNGVLLDTMAEELYKSGLHRVNVSLDSLKESSYKLLTRGGTLQQTRRGIQKAIDVGLKVKINVVVNKGINDDEVDDLISLAHLYDIDVRFIELMPIGTQVEYAYKHFVSNDSLIEIRPYLIPIKASDPSSPARYYKIEGKKGTIGFISPLSCNFCSHCNRLRITPEGKLRPCLHSDLEIDLKELIRQGKDIKPSIVLAYSIKPEKHLLDEHKTILRQMSQIGG